MEWGSQHVQQGDPGKQLGFLGAILVFLCLPAGVVVSLMAWQRSREAGYKNPLALGAFVTGVSILTLVGVVAVLVSIQGGD